jgi:hypothetical protein
MWVHCKELRRCLWCWGYHCDSGCPEENGASLPKRCNWEQIQRLWVCLIRVATLKAGHCHPSATIWLELCFQKDNAWDVLSSGPSRPKTWDYHGYRNQRLDDEIDGARTKQCCTNRVIPTIQETMLGLKSAETKVGRIGIKKAVYGPVMRK